MGMTLKDIRDLIRLVDKTSFEEVEIEHEGTKVLLRKVVEKSTQAITTVAVPPAETTVQTVSAPVQSPVQAAENVSSQSAAPASKESSAAEEDPSLHKIVSPMVGTFYRAPAPDADPYVKEGDQVDESTVVCIVEAMKLMNEIEAEVKGTIVKVLVENGQLVEYGQPLFLVKTT